jgi:HSP20 family protein
MHSAPLRSPFRWDPWHELDELRRSVERIGERSAEHVANGTAGLDFVPKVDLYDLGAAFVVRMDLPGVKDGNLEIIAEGNGLTIQGQRESDGPGERCLYCERSVGRFARTIALPASFDANRVEATLNLGILQITLPKDRTVAVKKVAVVVYKGE